MAKAKSSKRRKAKPSKIPTQFKLILAFSAIHIIGWFAYLSEEPIGQYPTPEEADRIETAFSLAQGYGSADRAPTLYEFGLSFAARFVDSDAELILIARSINAIALLLTTLLCAKAAGRYWKKPQPVWITGFLTGLNPVLAYWAAEIAPTLLCVLGAAFCFYQLLIWLRSPAPKQSLLIALGLTFTCALDGSVILLAAGWPLAALLYPTRRRLIHLAAAIGPPALMLVLFALTNLQLQNQIGFTVSNLVRGVHEVLNSHEAFDGKSYSLHKSLNFFLMINPIHWGALWIMALAGCWVRIKNGHQGNSLIAVAILFFAFALGYSLNEAGSQTRAMLYPIVGVFAGGIYFMPRIWRHARTGTRRIIIAGCIAAAALTYSDFFGSRDTRNWEQDYAFLAEANLALHHNKSASEWAEKALEINPGRNDMRSILVRAVFNEWALSPAPSPLPVETARLYLAATQAAQTGTPRIKAIEALYHFKLRDQDRAIRIWEESKAESALSLLCLFWIGNEPRPTRTQIGRYEGDPYFELLEKSIEINRNSVAYSEGEQLLDNMLANAH
jgi:hypothetical protein